MDIDAFSAIRSERWARLRELSSRRSLTGAEADEFTRLYQVTAGDLSAVRSSTWRTLRSKRAIVCRTWGTVIAGTVFFFPPRFQRQEPRGE